MPMTSPFTFSMAVTAVEAEGIKFKFDDDGDIRFVMTRDKGKDLVFYLMKAPTESGILSLACLVHRYFKGGARQTLLDFCNEWNRSRRMPVAAVSDPDSDGDLRVSLDYSMFCKTGATAELIGETLGAFIVTSGQFWDDLDEAT